MELVISGTREELVKDLREIVDAIQSDGAADWRITLNSRREDRTLSILFDTDEEYEGGIMFSRLDNFGKV